MRKHSHLWYEMQESAINGTRNDSTTIRKQSSRHIKYWHDISFWHGTQQKQRMADNGWLVIMADD